MAYGPRRSSLQVVCARGLRAADSNGLSDPYTVVRLGARSEQTRVVPESLDPDWNEAFVFSADDIEAGIMETGPRLLFEVWDSDIGVVADDFLGQACPPIHPLVTGSVNIGRWLPCVQCATAGVHIECLPSRVLKPSTLIRAIQDSVKLAVLKEDAAVSRPPWISQTSVQRRMARCSGCPCT